MLVSNYVREHSIIITFRSTILVIGLIWFACGHKKPLCRLRLLYDITGLSGKDELVTGTSDNDFVIQLPS